MQRKLFQSINEHINQKEFTILTGARQVGKSTLLKQLYNHLKKQKRPTVFINLENRNVLTELNKAPLNLLAFLPATDERIIVFIDEVQYLNDPTNFLKLLYDEHSDRLKIIATGSSAFYLDRKFTDSLAGRKKLFFMPTCSFDEYLQLRELNDLYADYQRIIQNGNAKSLLLTQLEQAFYDYMRFGGYPAVITEKKEKEKIARLQELRDSFVKRDIDESDIKNEQAFYNLFRLLAAQTGNMVNNNELSITLHLQNKTVQNYLYVLQKCFHICLIKPFYRNIRKELTKMPKVYLLDNGMRNCLLNNFQPFPFSTDRGATWENTVFRMLLEQYNADEINFWRTTSGNEVDFVINSTEKSFAVEVKVNELGINKSKYKLFVENYPDVPLHFAYIQPFIEKVLRL